MANINTEFHIGQINGCRHLTPVGQPLVWIPPEGSEVFVGKLPREITEVALYKFMLTVGPVHTIRLMVNFLGENRGYAFVRYHDAETAARAIQVLDKMCIKPNCPVAVCQSTDHRALLLLGLGPKVTEQEIRQVFSKVTGELISVTSLPSCSRGDFLLQFASHRAAAVARRGLAGELRNRWGSKVVLTWQYNDEVDKRMKYRREREERRRMLEESRIRYSVESLQTPVRSPTPPTPSSPVDFGGVLANIDQNTNTLQSSSWHVPNGEEASGFSHAPTVNQGPTDFGGVLANIDQNTNTLQSSSWHVPNGEEASGFSHAPTVKQEVENAVPSDAAIPKVRLNFKRNRPGAEVEDAVPSDAAIPKGRPILKQNQPGAEVEDAVPSDAAIPKGRPILKQNQPGAEVEDAVPSDAAIPKVRPILNRNRPVTFKWSLPVDELTSSLGYLKLDDEVTTENSTLRDFHFAGRNQLQARLRRNKPETSTQQNQPHTYFRL